MKRLLTTLISAILLISVALSVGCSCNDNWTEPTLTNPGNVLSQGGFVTETENYLYFINGEEDSTAENKFGQPIKGALLAVEKSSLTAESIKTEVIVPKLFTAKDLNAGVYIYGGYVYYGSPCVDKNSSGAIANDQMTFFKTSLDGKTTEEFFTIGSLTTEYRISAKEGVVYIVYYDTNEKALISYNTSNKTATTIAKTADNVSGQFESLGGYKFLDGEKDNSNGAVVAFTTTVYTEDYNADKASGAGYSRATANYNYLYTYTAGDTKAEGNGAYGVKALDGKTGEKTYAITYASGEYLFYTQKASSETATVNMAINLKDLTKTQEIVNADKLVAGTLIVSLGEAYYIDSDASFVVQFSFNKADIAKRANVCKADNVSALIAKFNGELYYHGGDSYINRIKLADQTANEVRITAKTASSTWYAPKFITVGENSFMFYIDSTTAGSKYVNFVKLNAEVKTEVKNEGEDNETTLYYLDADRFIGQFVEKDQINRVISAIDEIETTIEYTEENGAIVINTAKYDNAKKLYDELIAKDKEAKEQVGETRVAKLTNFENAKKLASYYYALKDYSTKDTANENYKSAYQTAKDFRKALLDVSEANYTSARDMLPEELKYYYQQAEDVLDPDLD